MWFIWKAGYANKHTINLCSFTFFPLRRFFHHRLTLWCKTHQQPQSWYVNLTCQTGGMLRASIVTQFPWWEVTVFMREWKTWCTSSEIICCGITHSLLSNDYMVQLPLGSQLPWSKAGLKRARNGNRRTHTPCCHKAGLSSNQTLAIKNWLTTTSAFPLWSLMPKGWEIWCQAILLIDKKSPPVLCSNSNKKVTTSNAAIPLLWNRCSGLLLFVFIYYQALLLGRQNSWTVMCTDPSSI